MKTSKALVASLFFAGTGVALSQPETQEWSRLDLAAIRAIEEHGQAGDVSPEQLYGASLVLQHARDMHREGHEAEAHALYYFVLTLGRVGQVNEKR